MTTSKLITQLENEHRLFFSRASHWYEFLLRSGISRTAIMSHYELQESNRELIMAFKAYLHNRTKEPSVPRLPVRPKTASPKNRDKSLKYWTNRFYTNVGSTRSVGPEFEPFKEFAESNKDHFISGQWDLIAGAAKLKWGLPTKNAVALTVYLNGLPSDQFMKQDDSHAQIGYIFSANNYRLGKSIAEGIKNGTFTKEYWENLTNATNFNF